jgi:hypothetical protein
VLGRGRLQEPSKGLDAVVHYGRVEVAVFAMDESKALVGGTYKKVAAHLQYGAEEFAFVKKNGIPLQMSVRVPSGTRYVRLVVYDYAADLVGSAASWVF